MYRALVVDRNLRTDYEMVGLRKKTLRLSRHTFAPSIGEDPPGSVSQRSTKTAAHDKTHVLLR